MKLSQFKCYSAVLVLIAALLFVHPSSANDQNELGIGMVVGEPSGIHSQFFWSHCSAIELTAAWSWNDWLSVSSDFQMYDYVLDWPREWKWYYGLGAYLTFPENEDGTFGARIPLGIKYHFPHSIVDIWLEADPALELVPDTQAQFQCGLGVTFWLK